MRFAVVCRVCSLKAVQKCKGFVSASDSVCEVTGRVVWCTSACQPRKARVLSCDTCCLAGGA